MSITTKVGIGLAIALTIYVIAQYIRTRHFLNIGLPIAAAAVAYEQHPQNPDQYFLVIGDSTAVGTGASRPEDSTAGLLGKDYPAADITNHGVNGARLADLAHSFDTFADDEFDLVLVQIGGNDVWHFTLFSKIETQLNTVLVEATRVGKHVVMMHGGDFISAKALPLGTRWIFSWRSSKLRNLYQRVLPTYGVSYVDVWHANDDKPDRAAAFYAIDQFHPSSSGYADWYGQIKLVLPKFEN